MISVEFFFYPKQVLTSSSQGSHDFSPLDFRNALHSIAQGRVRVAPMISHHLPLAQVKEGFDIVAGQKGLKVMIRTVAG